MQQQNNHIKPVADPELIRRYLAGELDHKAMHALERQALDDPFLADALEGFEQHAPDQRMHLADLNKRLEQRIQPAKRKVIPMYIRWAAAAAVCFVVGSSIIWLWPAGNKSEIAKVTVQTDTIIPGEVTTRVEVPETATLFRKQQENGKSYHAPAVAAPSIPPAPPPQAEVAVSEPAPAAFDVAKDSRTAAVSVAKTSGLPATIAGNRNFSSYLPTADTTKAFGFNSLFYKNDKDTAEILASQNFYRNYNFNANDVAVTALGTKRVSAASGFDPYMIKGRILNVKGDSGIAGATVSMGDVGTITDREGYFALPNNNMGLVPMHKKMSNSRQENTLVTASASGYQMNSTAVKGDPFIRMQLKRTTDTSAVALSSNNTPTPMGGFEQFEQYLSKNVQYPDGLTISGKVRVQFYVHPDGSLSDFRVLKKLQPDCDQEAIRVIKSGPAWMPAANGKSAKVKVEVKFSPEGH